MQDSGRPPWASGPLTLEGLSALARWEHDEIDAGEVLLAGKALHKAKRYGSKPPGQPITEATKNAMTRKALADFLTAMFTQAYQAVRDSGADLSKHPDDWPLPASDCGCGYCAAWRKMGFL